MTKTTLQTGDVSYIPWRKADETIFATILRNENWGGMPEIVYTHIDAHGYYNLYPNLYSLLDALVLDNNDKRIDSFNTEEELDNYLALEFKPL